MRPKSMVLILIALGCGLIASIGISQVMERKAGDTTSVKMSPIYVAVMDISAGEELTSQKIKFEEWPVDKIPDGAVTSPEQLDGKSPVQPLYDGEPLLLAKLADRDSLKGTAQRIRPGYRVMSVNVDAASAVAGLVMPGDHVDVMVFTKGSNAGGDRAEAILQDIEVFAVNDQIHRDTDSEGRKIEARTVSLLVTPDQAETLMLFTNTGLMSLSLRHPDEKEVASTEPKSTSSQGAAPLDTLKSLLPPFTASSGSPNATAEPIVVDNTPEFTMEVIEGGSGNVRSYNWDSRDSLPRELSTPSEITDQDALPPTINIDQLGTKTTTPEEEKSSSGDQSPPKSTPENGDADGQDHDQVSDD